MQRADSLEKTLVLGKTEGRRRRGWQRMSWLDGITDSMDTSLSTLQETVKSRGAWSAAAHGVTEQDLTSGLNNKKAHSRNQWDRKQKINETKSWLFEKINKTDKLLARMTTKGRRYDYQHQEWKRNITTDLIRIKKFIRKYSEQLYTKKLDNLGEMEKFPEINTLEKLTQKFWLDLWQVNKMD